MCGVVACHGDSSSPEHLRDQASTALRALAHRGPDESSVWMADEVGVALGHSRLTIVDLTLGAHPVQNEDRSVTAVVNGELYGDGDLRRELQAQGHRFRSNTDSEILVHLYEEHGLRCLQFLRGEFAFILWDSRQRRLFAARDRFGVKPLVYAERSSGALWLASEAKALFAAGFSAEWNHRAFAQVATHQYLTPENTMFRGIYQLLPGHYLIANAGGYSTKSYWDLDYPVRDEYQMAQDEAAAIIREQLEEAVRLRLRSDVPVACYLSGGLDSSSVLSLASRYSSRPLHAFGIAFEHGDYDEHRDAAGYAKEIGAEFTSVRVRQQDLLTHLSDAVFHAEGLCINGQLVAKYLLSRAVQREGYKVVLVGEGADEVFYGYAHLQHDHLLAGSVNSIERLKELQRRHPLQAGVMMPLGSLAGTRSADRTLPTFLHTKLAIGARLGPLLEPSFRASLHADPAGELLDRFSSQLTDRHPVVQAAYLWSKLALVSYILRTLGDGTEMAHSIEGRVPFLDHHLFELSRSLPPSRHLEGGGAKQLLRDAMTGVVPERIRLREKRPLLAPPIALHSDRTARDLVMDVVGSQSFKAVPFFDAKKVLGWVQSLGHRSPQERQVAEPILMTFLSAAAMQQQFRLGAGDV